MSGPELFYRGSFTSGPNQRTCLQRPGVTSNNDRILSIVGFLPRPMILRLFHPLSTGSPVTCGYVFFEFLRHSSGYFTHSRPELSPFLYPNYRGTNNLFSRYVDDLPEHSCETPSGNSRTTIDHCTRSQYKVFLEFSIFSSGGS